MKYTRGPPETKLRAPVTGLCSLALAVDSDRYRQVVLVLCGLQFVFGHDLGGDLAGAVDLDEQERVVLALVDLDALVEEHAQGVIPNDVDGVLIVHTTPFG